MPDPVQKGKARHQGLGIQPQRATIRSTEPPQLQPSPPPPAAPRSRPLWLRLLIVIGITGSCGALVIGGIVLAAIVAFQQPWLQMWFMRHSPDQQFGNAREPAERPAAPYTLPEPDPAQIQSAADFFRPTNIWPIHLRFTREEFEALGPRRVPPYQNWLRGDGAPLLNNPNAIRAGLAGVFGYDQPWSSGTVEFGALPFTNVAVRFKGNGTFVGSLRNYKRPFKLDFDKHVDRRLFGGQSTLNLHNLTADSSFIGDTLAYEFYRAAGVPAPRTTYARVFLTIDGRWEHRLLGLYAVIENPDANWAKSAFGTKGVALYKPVTLDLFSDLGDRWVPYEQTYRPKATPTPAQRQRLVDLARFVPLATDAEFQRRLGDFFDLDEVARFFACEALLTNLDGIFSNGQNFYLWHDPSSDRFGFSPWDLDHSWGEFPWVGSRATRETADLFHPWVGKNRFLERLYSHPDFQARYRRELGRLLDTVFQPALLHRRIDELADIVRPAVAEESTKRLARFEKSIRETPDPGPDQEQVGWGDDESRPVHHLKRFITARAQHARAQLEGREKGTQLRRSR